MKTAMLSLRNKAGDPAGKRQITDKQVRKAIAQYDEEYPLNDYPRTAPKPQAKTWLENGAYHFAIKYLGRCYPPKKILWAAIGPGSEDQYRFHGGKHANGVLTQLGFEVVDKKECRQTRPLDTRKLAQAKATWSMWTPLDQPAKYDAHAVYRIRLTVAGQPVSINRFLGVDTCGLVCIGRSSRFARRRGKFARALRRGTGHSEANLLHLLEKYTPLRSVYEGGGYEYSYRRLPGKKEARGAEADLIRAYVARFGEPPPLNSSIPDRYNREAWEAVS